MSVDKKQELLPVTYTSAFSILRTADMTKATNADNVRNTFFIFTKLLREIVSQGKHNRVYIQTLDTNPTKFIALCNEFRGICTSNTLRFTLRRKATRGGCSHRTGCHRDSQPNYIGRRQACQSTMKIVLLLCRLAFRRVHRPNCRLCHQL